MSDSPRETGHGKPPPLSRKKKILFALLFTLLPLLLLEAGLRLSGAEFGWEVEAPLARRQLEAYVGRSEMWSDEDLLQANFSIYVDDRTRLWRLEGDLDVEIGNFLVPHDLRGIRTFAVKTNEQGFRGPLPPAAGKRKTVLCLGDSHTFGWGLEEEETFPARLQRLLDGEEPDRYAVANAGQPGYSSFQGRVLWEEGGRDLAPAYVVLAFGFNDGLKAPIADEDAAARRAGAPGFLRHALMLTRTYRLLRHAILSARGAGGADIEGMGRRVPREKYRAHLARMVEDVRKCGGRPVFLSLLCRYHRTLTELARDLDVPLVDADAYAEQAREALVAGRGDAAWRAEALERFGPARLEKNPSWWVRADAAHYNRFVHEAVAEALAEIILAD